jgi:hypothetical protein
MAHKEESMDVQEIVVILIVGIAVLWAVPM